METVSRCLSRQKFPSPSEDGDLQQEDSSPSPSPHISQILQNYPLALVSFVHRPTPSGDHTTEKDLEFFQVAQDEFDLSCLLLQQKKTHGEEHEDGDEEDMVYLYALYFAQ